MWYSDNIVQLYLQTRGVEQHRTLCKNPITAHSSYWTDPTVFNDLLTNFERVADHCSNIAIAMIELKKDEFQTHDYVINLKELHAHNFEKLYNEYAEKYRV